MIRPGRVPVLLCAFAALTLLLGELRTAEARGKRYRRRSRARRPPRVAMLLRDLPITWTSTTEGREVVIDAEPEHVPPDIRIRSTRSKLTQAACYGALRSLGIKYKRGPKKGRLIAHPVIVSGWIGGIHYKNKYKRKPMLADCQLVLTLHRAAAVFRKHGIKRVLYTNTWRAPFWNFARKRSMPSRGRKIGNHPRGLAMDASVFIDTKGNKYVVEPDWEKIYGGPGRCVGRAKTKKGRLLRKIICDLEKHHVFRRILTPDSNWEHLHHFHFTSPRVNEAFVRARWAGRVLSQPLPGTRRYKGWNRWYRCYKIRNARRRWRCYKRRRKQKTKPAVRFQQPRQKPRVALKLVVPEPATAEPPKATPAVDPDKTNGAPDGVPRPAVRPRRLPPPPPK